MLVAGLTSQITHDQKRDYIAFFLTMRAPGASERFKELVSLVEMPQGYLARIPNHLSGGQRLCICFVRAITAKAKPKMSVHRVKPRSEHIRTN